MRFAVCVAVVVGGCSGVETPGTVDGAVGSEDGNPRPERADAAAIVFSCPLDHAVSGIAAGAPVCRPAGPDGLAPAWDGVQTSNNFTCPAGYEVGLLHFDCGCTNNSNWYGCFLPEAAVAGSTSYTAPDVADFSCPRGTLLRGFDATGQPLCRSDATIPLGFGLAPYWDGVQTGNNFSCPFGYSLEMHHFDCGCSNNATWGVCVRAAAAESDNPVPVAATARGDLLDTVCEPGQLVTGFTADDRPLCGAIATEIPAGFGINGAWDGVFTGNNFSCPAGFSNTLHHSDCGCSNNANWSACIAP